MYPIRVPVLQNWLLTGWTKGDTKSLLGWFWYKSYRVLCDFFSFHANSNQIFSLFWIKQFLHDGANDVNNIAATKVIATMSLGSIAPSPHAPHKPAIGTLSRWHQAASHASMVVLWLWRWCKHYMVAALVMLSCCFACMMLCSQGLMPHVVVGQCWYCDLQLSRNCGYRNCGSQ